MLVPGYRVHEELSRDDLFVLARGARSPDGAPVLLKTALAPSAAATAALRREYDLLRSLDVGGVARPAAFDAAAGAVVLPDTGARPLRRVVANGRPELGRFLHIARRLALALDGLHRRRLVHRGLNPDGVFVDAGTGEPILVDLGAASELEEETQRPRPLHVFGDRLAYVAPEQTGRMNRVVDYRADLYSLGALFHYLLTGAPPFASQDPLELVHSLIARVPKAPAEVDPAIPPVVSAIVMKLLAKTAEERYQSAAGLAADLAVCAERWATGSGIPAFPLATRDVSERFTIPQRLYGRDGEVRALLRAFEQVCAGPPALLMLAGYSGVGKTALVNEVHKPILRHRGLFLSGKFDQLRRSVPYDALTRAFGGLLLQLLAEPEERIASFQDALREALGANPGVISAVIPELELLLGPQPAAPVLGPAEARNRFHYYFQSFLGVFARAEHPLVVFLDDLQWADPATLMLLSRLLPNPGVRHLLVIGAYRDNEVAPGDPLLKMAEEVRAAGARVLEITLPPLALPHLRELMADALRRDGAPVDDLARLVLGKTAGNPFFVIQFLKALFAEGLLEFDHAAGRFGFDLGRLDQSAMTDNVVDLMTRKLQKLPAAAQQAVALAACVGNSFSLETLAVVRQRSMRETADELWAAIEEGLVLPAREGYEQLRVAPEAVLAEATLSYRFLHDRVQQAAYASIPEEQRKPVHLRVGRLLLAGGGEPAPEDRVFEIVNHLNIGRDLIPDGPERSRLVDLNLRAGRRAKESAAFRAALDYFERGLGLLPPDRWTSRYELTLALTKEVAECRYLCGRFEEAESCFETLLRESRSPLEKAEAQRMRLVQYESQARYAEAVRVGRESLALVGVTLPDDEAGKRAALDDELARIQAALGERTIASLDGLPTMADPETKMIVTLLTALWASAYISGDGALSSLLSARMVRLSIEHGNTEDSAYGYVTHAITVGPVGGDYRAAYEWGDLALRVNHRFQDRKRRAKIHQQFNAHVNLWRRPLETSLPHAREACRSGLETGDLTYAGYGAFTETWAELLTCRDLDRFLRDCAPTVALLERIRMTSLAAAQELFLAWARALRGQTSEPGSLSHAGFDERAYVSANAANPFCMTFYYAAKLHLGVTFEEFGPALEAARTARREAWTPSGTIWPVFLDFWGGLAMAALYPKASEEDRRSYRREILAARDSLQVLAENCPENFRCFALVLAAEVKRLDGRPLESLELQDEAIRYARGTENVQQEALANELAARLWLERGREAVAADYLDEARRCYAAWGAAAKVRDLEARYGRLPGGGPATGPGAGGREAVSLDLATVLKAAHAIAVEIELDELLKKLMQIALENAGAERGVFLQASRESLLVQAEAVADTGQVTLRQSIPLEQAQALSRRVVRYVRRTGQGVVVGDAATDERFSGDPYVAQSGCRSILCVPVVSQGTLGGILYLENNLTTGAFTSKHVEMMRLLAAEAGIALENARLYEGMREEVERRSRAEAALREAVAELQALKDRLQAENVYLQEEIRTQHNFEEIVGNSPALLEALRQVERVAPTDASVLIFGETGTGKELFARAIHSRSRRKDRPLVKVNCGAIAPGLVESELFGHVKGAFTGAAQNRTGRFELADRGTIFLDEVSELPLETQVKLLRVLQEREFEPVGSSRTVRVDVRVIAASNRRLDEAVRAGRFREDLLYRLNVFPLAVPPLRERRSDLPVLVSFFVTRMAKKLGKPLEGVSRRSMQRLMSYAWPGNVREVQNVIERAAILARGPLLELEADFPAPGPAPTSRSLEDVERDHIVGVLKETGGVVEGPRGAAAVLGLHPNTLRSRMKKLRIERTRPGEA